MKRLKIGITAQLVILVVFASILSPLILSLCTGIYFKNNTKNMRTERLEVISGSKAAQVKQAVEYIFSQVDWLSRQDMIISPVVKYDMGNKSQSLLSSAKIGLDQFSSASPYYAASTLYDYDFNEIVRSYNNNTNISSAALKKLLPSSEDFFTKTNLRSKNAQPILFSGPVSNGSDPQSAYFMGLTVPIYASASIILPLKRVAGFLTSIANVQNLRDTVSGNNNLNDYCVNVLELNIDMRRKSSNYTLPPKFRLILSSEKTGLRPDVQYNTTAYELAAKTLSANSGAFENIENFNGIKVAISFMRIQFDTSLSWTVIIEQKQSSFYQPINKLVHIIIGVVIGVAAFMCLITFPLAMFLVRPIKILRAATEEITRSRKRKLNSPAMDSNVLDSTVLETPEKANFASDDKDSVKTSRKGSFASGQYLYSSGFRVPEKVRSSKKFFKDEITELTEAFNIMIENLSMYYQHLEDRVRSRTKELEVLKLEAEAANEAKTVFIANISHELRTPLNGILGMATIAMEETDLTKIRDSLILITRSGELLLRLLTELLTFSRNSLNKSKLVKSNFQILDIAHQVKSIFCKLAIDQGINFKITIRPSVMRNLVLFGDCNRIIQVVMNSVSNGFKFTPFDGDVSVTFRLLGEYDYERSEKDNFEEVYVLERERFSNVGVQGPIKPDHLNSMLREDRNTGGYSNDVSDKNSLLTLSTGSYKETLVHPHASLHPDSKSENSFVKVNGGSGTVKEDSSMVNLSQLDKANLSDKVDEVTSSTSKEDIFEKSDQSSVFSHCENFNSSKTFKVRPLKNKIVWVLQILVTDTGPGIDPKLQEKIFDPFTQGDQTLSRRHGGAGLGLSICRQLAKMMKGTMRIKSEVGKGSTFVFTIPLTQVGEILVKPEDFEEFYRDEFNPNSKMNRRVTFDVEQDSCTLKHQDAPSENSPLRESSDANVVNGNNVKQTEQDNTEGLTKSLPGVSEIPEDENVAQAYLHRPQLLTSSSIGTGISHIEKSRDNGESSALKILIAEDNMVNQEVIKRMLKLEGYEDITVACNGEEAIEIVQSSIREACVFDLVLMDIQMPKLDGLSATKLLRDMQFEKPIIALTAFADDNNAEECLKYGMSGFLSKPIKREKLRKIISEHHSLCSSSDLSPNI